MTQAATRGQQAGEMTSSSEAVWRERRESGGEASTRDHPSNNPQPGNAQGGSGAGIMVIALRRVSAPSEVAPGPYSTFDRQLSLKPDVTALIRRSCPFDEEKKPSAGVEAENRADAAGGPSGDGGQPPQRSARWSDLHFSTYAMYGSAWIFAVGERG
ncbi:MAG: hypothetical protein BJ554DRAFT_4243 [Olpidium bornovanus]|uniref:Uncharacterized protein n=1 Tax=Olpidium bornovanus TaxID=278681 RepID=A0A8H8DFD0_9FUNG|nr:MAG: hypothetical protein BJ554DRAFT_4243 [Olpidium bornovanus]